MLQNSRSPPPHGNIPRSASSVNFNFERIYHLISLDYGNPHVGVWIKMLLAKLNFVHVDSPYLIHQKQYVTLREYLLLAQYYPPDISDTF